MAKTTGIEWCDSTINPVPGCTGCELYHPVPAHNHCYAATLCNRYAGCKGWPRSFTEPELFPGRIEKAIAWADLTGKERSEKPWLNGYPRIIFLNDLGDTFAPTAPNPEDWLVPLMAEMAKSSHLWLFLTKWPRRMCEFFIKYTMPENFWLGTSIINQKWADKNVRWLLQTPAAVRFVSFEPLLDDIVTAFKPGYEKIDWAIVGGESGPKARPMHPNSVRALREWALCWGIPFFFKQWGRWVDYYNAPVETRALIDDGRWRDGYADDHHVFEVGKKAAGRLLDGREWNEMPEVKR